MDPSIPESAAAPSDSINENKSFSWRELLRDLFETVVLAVLLFVGISAVSARVRVDGYSMVPTLKNGEYVLVNRLAYRFGEPQRGDIIVFRRMGEDLIKRVIGLPGDTVRIFDGVVQVNGQTLQEPYIAAPPHYNGEWQVPEGELFVLGDNRNDSSDSHVWGTLPLQNVVGRAIVIYWPPAEWKILEHIPLDG